jgi:thioredoxin reductase
MSEERDVVVIGGGAAGLSGAVMLARSRRSVLVVDAGEPRNAPADGVHGLLGQEGVPPAELLARGRDELAAYGGEVVPGRVVDARRDEGGFLVTTDDGRTVRARRLLVATGLVDELPDVPGLRERWGRDVLHCPYCHGWEVRDRAIGVLATSARALHQAMLFRQLSDDVVVFRHTADPFDDAQSATLRARGVRVVDGTVDEVVVDGDRLVGVRVGSTVTPRDALVVAPRFTARTVGLEGLGLDVEVLDGAAGTYAVAGESGTTNVPGVWVAGNVTDLFAQVGASLAAGTRAGAMINADLVDEDVRRAVAGAA